MTDPTTDAPSEVDALVAEVADEFCARRARGESPDPEEYAARHPEAAAILRGAGRPQPGAGRPPDPAAGRGRGRVLYGSMLEGVGQSDEAVGAFRRVVELTPDIRTDKARLQPEPLELGGVARQAAQGHRPAFEAKGLASPRGRRNNRCGLAATAPGWPKSSTTCSPTRSSSPRRASGSNWL